MTETYKRLGSAVVGTASGAIYTVPGSAQVIVKTIVLVNVSSSTTIQVWAGASATDQYCILPPVTLGPNESIVWDGTLILGSGDAVYADAGATSSIACQISGLEIT